MRNTMLPLGGALSAMILLSGLGCGGNDDATTMADGAPTAADAAPDGAPAIDGPLPDSAPAIDGSLPDDAGPLDAMPEPTPAFTASGYVSGQLAITQDGLRETFTANGNSYYSNITISLTADGASEFCNVTLLPHFVEFSTQSTSGRFFKTAVIDLAESSVLADACNWDDAHITSQLGAQFGTLELGFARARFEEDRPAVDVVINAVNPFGDTDFIVLAGGGIAFPMDDAGIVDDTVNVEPEGGTLATALYQW